MQLVVSVLAAVLILGTGDFAAAKRYGRCELAEELKNQHGFTSSELPDWMCLIQHESGRDTAALGINSGQRPSKDYGIFQINDYFWCETDKGTNDCNINCSLLQDSDISDDVDCARKVHRRHGFDAWYGWKNNCRGVSLSSYVEGCNI